tara:strand:- start:264 stop:2123 length:1860 start_codon:yes stop_codon:yes gene_type:complete
MITKIFEIITKTEGSVKEINKLNKSLETTDKSIEKVNDDALDLETNLKGVPKATRKIAGGFRLMGTALKAAGVGLAIAAFTTLKELFSQQQVIVDTFKVSFEMLSLAFTDFFKYISQNVGAISGYFKSLFDDPKAAVMGLVDAIENYLIHFLDKTLEYFGFLAKGFAKLVTGDFSGAMDNFKAGLNAGVDAITGVDDTTKKVNETFDAGVKALGEYTISTYKQAKSNVELAKTADLAAVANQGLIEKYDRQAEQQRQIRDDERKSVADRKKANDELLAILDKQEVAMLANAQTQLKNAEVQLQKDEKNVEALKAKGEALNEIAAIEAQIEGFRSEQQTNAAALQKEEQELISSRLESENNLSIERKRFVAEQIKDEKEKLLELQKIDKEEAELGRERLTNEIALYKEGTQAKVDAEIALAEFEEEIYQQRVNRSNELTALELSNQKKSTKSQQEKLDTFEQAATTTMNALIAINELTQAFAKQDEESQKKAFKVNKALGIANAIINTSVGVSKALASSAPPLNFINAAIVTATGIAAVKNIEKTRFDSSAFDIEAPSTNTGGAATSPSQAPSFNVVGQSGFNQVAGALGQQPPVQAFVVAGNVTTAQQLQNNTITQATF